MSLANTALLTKPCGLSDEGKPFAIDLYCGLGGWTDGLLAEGWFVVGFDIEQHVYGDHRYPAQLVLQDVLTLNGAQFKDASLIVASPPCQEFSYMAMPWRRGKQIARALRGEDEFPDGYTGSRTAAELTALFDACFRIQREASEAAGHHVPLVVENVRGAQPWVGRARWSFGSFFLWGDVPALMPMTAKAVKVPNFRFDGSGKSFQSEAVKVGGLDWNKRIPGQAFNTHAERLNSQAIKGAGGSWFFKYQAGQPGRSTASGSIKRKMASAMIAKIPLPLSRHIAAVYRPKRANLTPEEPKR